MAKIKVENHPGYVRDTLTGAILNTNVEEIRAAKARKAAKEKEKEDINNLKNEVSDIKNMLGKIIEKLDGSNTNTTN